MWSFCIGSSEEVGADVRGDEDGRRGVDLNLAFCASWSHPHQQWLVRADGGMVFDVGTKGVSFAIFTTDSEGVAFEL